MVELGREDDRAIPIDRLDKPFHRLASPTRIRGEDSIGKEALVFAKPGHGGSRPNASIVQRAFMVILGRGIPTALGVAKEK